MICCFHNNDPRGKICNMSMNVTIRRGEYIMTEMTVIPLSDIHEDLSKHGRLDETLSPTASNPKMQHTNKEQRYKQQQCKAHKATNTSKAETQI